MELMLSECLSKVCLCFYEEKDLELKMNLCQEITDFLLSTPDVFIDTSLTTLPRKPWLCHISNTVRHLLQNQLPNDKRVLLFKLMSSLTHGLHRIDWFVDQESWTEDDCKFFGLMTRLTAIEIVMLLERLSGQESGDTTSLQSDHLGSLLILVEHEMSCLLENDSSTSLMSPDEVGSLISSIRGVASNVIEFLVLKQHSPVEVDNESRKRSLSDLEESSQTASMSIECLSLVRFLCQWLLEDTDVTEDQAEQITPILISSFLSQSQHQAMESPLFEHGILSALLSLNDVKEVLVVDHELKEVLDKQTSSCLVCREGEQEDLPICQEFRARILLRNM